MTRSPRILVIDDNPDLQDALTEVLNESGYVVTVVSDGAEALAWLRSHPAPALILLDLMMPGMDGFAFRAEQKADPRLATIPVVVLTARSLIDAQTRELAAANYFAKPLKVPLLIDAVRRLVASGVEHGADQ